MSLQLVDEAMTRRAAGRAAAQADAETEAAALGGRTAAEQAVMDANDAAAESRPEPGDHAAAQAAAYDELMADMEAEAG